MKYLIFTLFIFTTLFVHSQNILTVSNNTVKIKGYKSVRYVISNKGNTYIGHHLPLLLNVKEGTEWFVIVYNNGDKDRYELQNNPKTKNILNEQLDCFSEIKDKENKSNAHFMSSSEKYYCLSQIGDLLKK